MSALLASMGGLLDDIPSSPWKLPSQAAILSATVYPYAVLVRYRDAAGRVVDEWRIVMAHEADDIDEVSLVPEGCEFMRAERMPIERLHSLPVAQRERYRPAFKSYWLWRRSRDPAVGKPVAELITHVDYDPILLDMEVNRWVRPFNNWQGD